MEVLAGTITTMAYLRMKIGITMADRKRGTNFQKCSPTSRDGELRSQADHQSPEEGRQNLQKIDMVTPVLILKLVTGSLISFPIHIDNMWSGGTRCTTIS